jgi:hypothetical protein
MKLTYRLDEFRALRDARYHVQVRVIGVPYVRPVLERGYGPASVKGEIVNVFRGDEDLKIGDKVKFSANCHTDEKNRPLGGYCGYRLDEFEKVEFFEVFLNGAPPHCQLAHEGSTYIIEATSITPKCDIPTEEDIQLEIEKLRKLGVI